MLQKCNVLEYGNSTCNQIIVLLAVRGIWSRPYHLTPPESDVRIRHMDSVAEQS